MTEEERNEKARERLREAMNRDPELKEMVSNLVENLSNKDKKSFRDREASED